MPMSNGPPLPCVQCKEMTLFLCGDCPYALCFSHRCYCDHIYRRHSIFRACDRESWDAERGSLREHSVFAPIHLTVWWLFGDRIVRIAQPLVYAHCLRVAITEHCMWNGSEVGRFLTFWRDAQRLFDSIGHNFIVKHQLLYNCSVSARSSKASGGQH